MCARFTLTRSGRELARHFGLDAEPQLAARYNVAPGQEIATLRAEAEFGRVLRWAQWGLVPAWADDPGVGRRLINARSESAAERPAFREALRLRRCIVPADGFYEWGGADGRSPHLYRVRGGELFGIAALWERWRDRDGGALESCTLLTAPANERVRAVHDRMPVILAPEHYARWLDPALREPDALRALLAACPAEWLDATRVGDAVNRPENDDPRCIEPSREPQTGSLFGDPC